ncbi:hypothetical protein, variant 1 [Aphanomyces invadans]|uniref:Thioredoxin domain-containing protein n=1 Tax=Aphanomyces invadans TaxID=157072 RepID=A0A024TRJ3_9STRA|nr:hypothetical protein, variant 1 [Aphanomyces invadans]ETV96251.1 hypothetical protein, variant 1 [Aphanomyces invadans]|eukprot:XP_008875043.1 hypothetical protein, variant 1 [Aphanomyces invadans]
MIKLITVLVAVFAAVAAVEGDYRMPVKVIFRAFCSACKWFISDPIFMLLQDDEFRAVTDIQYVPAAAMTETATGGVTCYGGKEECEGHLWMACILDRFKTSPKITGIHMACFESDESGYTWQGKVAYCFSDAADVAALTECKANQALPLLRELMVVAKANEGPWQPYTIVDDIVLGSATVGVSLDMVKDEICRHFNGPAELLPAYCMNVAGVVLRTPPPVTATDPPAAEKVTVQVVWRAYCPACQWFFSHPFYQVLSDAAFQAIVDIELYPSGSTKETSPGVFTCTGGASECAGHLYMSCALRLFPQLHDVAANFKCMEESSDTWDRRMAACFSGPGLEKIKACFGSDESKRYLHDYVAVTSTMDTPWMPYIKVNGKVQGTATTGVGYDMLTKAICDAYDSEVWSWRLYHECDSTAGESAERLCTVGEGTG